MAPHAIWFPHKKHEVPPTHTLKEYPPFKGGGGLKTEIFHFGGVTPPHLEIFQLKNSGL